MAAAPALQVPGATGGRPDPAGGEYSLLARGGDGDPAFQTRESLGTNPVDRHQVINSFEAAFPFPVVDNPAGQHGSDPGEGHQLGLGGGVDRHPAEVDIGDPVVSDQAGVPVVGGGLHIGIYGHIGREIIGRAGAQVVLVIVIAVPDQKGISRPGLGVPLRIGVLEKTLDGQRGEVSEAEGSVDIADLEYFHLQPAGFPEVGQGLDRRPEVGVGDDDVIDGSGGDEVGGGVLHQRGAGGGVLPSRPVTFFPRLPLAEVESVIAAGLDGELGYPAGSFRVGDLVEGKVGAGETGDAVVALAGGAEGESVFVAGIIPVIGEVETVD